ncbi:MAG: hypothetical protein AAB677_00055 [Patescibacteria group bacterium]
MAKEKKKVELEDLALMVKHGFDAVDERFKKVDDQFEKIDQRFNEIHQRMDLEFGAIRSDIRDIKGTLGPLVRSMASLENDFSSLRIRVAYLEQKVGVEK